VGVERVDPADNDPCRLTGAPTIAGDLDSGGFALQGVQEVVIDRQFQFPAIDHIDGVAQWSVPTGKPQCGYHHLIELISFRQYHIDSTLTFYLDFLRLVTDIGKP